MTVRQKVLLSANYLLPLMAGAGNLLFLMKPIQYPTLPLMQKVDSMIAYANSKGITVWVHGWWSRKNLNLTAGEEKMKRWWRYLVHRLGAYNVIWVMAGEYNMDNYGGLGLAFWKELGQMIKTEDPYSRIVGVHNTPPFLERRNGSSPMVYSRSASPGTMAIIIKAR